MSSAALEVVVEVAIDQSTLLNSLRKEALRGLTAPFKELSPRWFYDKRGSGIFQQITRLPEYYLARCEVEILARERHRIARLAGAETLVELGAGFSEKTRLLIEAMRAEGWLGLFVPFDICETAVCAGANSIAALYSIPVHAIVGDFELHLDRVPVGGRRLFAFLGGTIGNLPPRRRARFLTSLSAIMEPGENLLLGADLHKDRATLERAYNDRRGITAKFNRNILEVMNRRLGGNFRPENFAHVAFFDTENEWIEMRLRSRRATAVDLTRCGTRIILAEGESIRTEISAKFRIVSLLRDLRAAGLEVQEWFFDDGGRYALTLAQKA